MIRRATLAHLDEIVDLGRRFHATDRWAGTVSFEAADFEKTCAAIIERGVIFLSDDGLIGLSVSPSIYNHAQRVCSELFFWAPDGQGDALYRAAAQWAAENADVFVISAHEPADPRLTHFYRRKGFAPIGHQFAKVI